MIVIDEAS